MIFKPHPYQQYCIDKVIQNNALGLFLDMGLGKTIITLTAINELKYGYFDINKVLVIAPKKVAEATWQREAAKWDNTKHLKMVTVMGTAAKRLEALKEQGDIYVISRDNVKWLVDTVRHAWPFDMVVVDEFSSFKSHTAKRFKALAAIRPRIKRLVGLTGTPSPNSLLDLWAQVYLLDAGLRLGKKITAYRDRFFVPGRRNREVIFDYKPKPGAREDILQRIGDICISMKSEDYLQLPDIIYNTVPVVLDAKARKAYDTMERNMVLEVSDSEAIDAPSATALSNKLQQLANGAIYNEFHEWTEIHTCKLDAFMELVESLAGKHVLVFYSFISDLERMQAALSKTGLIVKKLAGPEDEIAWNEGKIDILLAHPASAAYGLNLQEGGNHIIWYGLTWNLEQYLQANKRLHRQGQKEKVIIHQLVTEGTRDEDLVRALDRKEGAQAYVLESLKARINNIHNSRR